jgi:23S rRNA A2030 N6-methylase RlmJ
MYDHGNLGDIIKHAWLAEVTLLLARRHPAVPFRYADSFCGRPPYPLANAFRPRLESLKSLRYLAIQQELLQNGQYQGSTGLVRAICRAEGIPVELYVSDQNAAALQACLDTIPECRQLRIDPNDGYASLEVESGLDLILLDPFSDFVAGDAIPTCSRRHGEYRSFSRSAAGGSGAVEHSARTPRQTCHGD